VNGCQVSGTRCQVSRATCQADRSAVAKSAKRVGGCRRLLAWLQRLDSSCWHLNWLCHCLKCSRQSCMANAGADMNPSGSDTAVSGADRTIPGSSMTVLGNDTALAGTNMPVLGADRAEECKRMFDLAERGWRGEGQRRREEGSTTSRRMAPSRCAAADARCPRCGRALGTREPSATLQPLLRVPDLLPSLLLRSAALYPFRVSGAAKS
jgi:hypothetical protein